MSWLGWAVWGWAGVTGDWHWAGKQRPTEPLHGPCGAHLQVSTPNPPRTHPAPTRDWAGRDGLAAERSTGVAGWMEILSRNYLGTILAYYLGWASCWLGCNPNVDKVLELV